MATDVLERLRAVDPAAAMPEPDADERERLRRAIVATPLEPRAARRWPRLRGRTLAVLVAGAVLLGGGAVYAGGYVANVFTPSRGTPSQGELVWKFKAGGGAPWASPTISDGVVYFGSVTATSTRSTPRAASRYGSSRGRHGRVHRPSRTAWSTSAALTRRYLYAVDARSGQEKWKFETAGMVGSPNRPSRMGWSTSADDGYSTPWTPRAGRRSGSSADGRPQSSGKAMSIRACLTGRLGWGGLRR